MSAVMSLGSLWVAKRHVSCLAMVLVVATNETDDYVGVIFYDATPSDVMWQYVPSLLRSYEMLST